MKIIGMIPARGGSSRFNNKPLALICGKPMVYWVWKHSKEVSVFEEVYVATDSEEIRQTVENFGGKVIMTSKDCETATERLYECSKKIEADLWVMVNGDEATISSDITIEAVPAYNTTEGREKFHPKGRDNGYILTLDGTRIYIAGDTEDIPEMANIKDIDIAFMPCNQPYTMTVEQLLKAARIVKPKVLFPYHFGQTDVSSVPAQLKNDGIEVRLRKLN